MGIEAIDLASPGADAAEVTEVDGVVASVHQAAPDDDLADEGPPGPGVLRKAVVIVAHPRAGTHLTLDFIRRNFPQFNPPLAPWRSAADLYVNLDAYDWRRQIDRLAQRTGRAIFQSHNAGLTDYVGRASVRYARPDAAFFAYPFRRFSATVRSFAEFSGWTGPVADFLGQRDGFFGTPDTVEACLRRHAERWIGREPGFVDVDRLRADPETSVGRLADWLGEAAAARRRPLPRHKALDGKLAELVQRLTGRESTEVKIPRRLEWSNPDEAAAIDARFADLYAELAARSVV